MMFLRCSFVILSTVFCFLFFFFSQWESKIGVHIIHGCALYTGKHGNNCRLHFWRYLYKESQTESGWLAIIGTVVAK